MNSDLLSGWLLGIFFGQLLGIIIISNAHKTDGGWGMVEIEFHSQKFIFFPFALGG